MGDVFLGKHKLLSKNKGIAEQLAKRMAAFLQVGVSTRQPSDEEIERRALAPLAWVMVIAVLFMLANGALQLIGGLGGWRIVPERPQPLARHPVAALRAPVA